MATSPKSRAPEVKVQAGAAAKKTVLCTVKPGRTLHHDGEEYAEGEQVEMSRAAAAPLQALGVLLADDTEGQAAAQE